MRDADTENVAHRVLLNPRGGHRRQCAIIAENAPRCARVLAGRPGRPAIVAGDYSFNSRNCFTSARPADRM